jgi:hypothetical protein
MRLDVICERHNHHPVSGFQKGILWVISTGTFIIVAVNPLFQRQPGKHLLATNLVKSDDFWHVSE